MPYLTGYEHDVFVSYAHGPRIRKGRDPVGQWSCELVDELSGRLAAKLLRKDDRVPDVWMDPRLQGNHGLSEALRYAVEHSAILLVIMSNFYLQSTVCRQEVEWFRAAAAKRRESTKRIFVIHGWFTDRSQWKNVGLQHYDGVGYRFIPKDDEQADPFGYPHANENDPDFPAYKAACSKIVQDLAAEIRNIEILESGVPVSHKSSPKKRNVLLGLMSDSLQDDRDELRTKLESDHITVLPPAEDDPAGENALRDVLESYGDRVDAAVLMANEHVGMWPKGQDGGFVSYQIRWAKESDIPCYLWLRVEDLTRIRRNEYREYLEALSEQAADVELQIRHPDLDHFAAHIRNSILSTDPPDPGVEQLAVICSNLPEDREVGQQFRDAIREVIRETRREIFLFDFANNEEHIRLERLGERIRAADTVLVLCFDQAWDWARTLIKEINGLVEGLARHKTQILVAGPKDKRDGLYDASVFGFKTVDGLHVDVDELKHRVTNEMVARARGPEP